MLSCMGLIIADEINIQKPVRITNALKTLQSGMRIGMTGTPVENNLMNFGILWIGFHPGYWIIVDI